MTHKRIIVFSLFLIINSCDFIAFASDIIPKPNSKIITSGEFILSNNTKINYSDDFKISGDFLMDYIISEEHVEEYVNKINFIKKNIKNDE